MKSKSMITGTTGGLKFEPLWFDSLGAKSSSVLVQTPDVNILIDPGASAMQPGFPISRVRKAFYRLRALRRISGAARKAQVVAISHYHFDHFCRLDLKSLDSAALYRDKKVFIKDPNQFVNFSQLARARMFFDQIVRKYGETKLDRVLEPANNSVFPEPEDAMPLAFGKSFGSYQTRREEILAKGRKWFRSLSRMWASNLWIPQLRFNNTEFKFMDGIRVEFGDTVLRFTHPVFHGVEYDRLGWVCSTIVEHNGVKLIHTSDVQGPVIEDVADWIVRENPNVVFIDGPPTYLMGFIMNKTNFIRAVENVSRIIRESDKTELIIYDHHLMRDPLFRKRVAEVYRVAEANGKSVISAAEYLGQEIVALKTRRSPHPLS